jgi:hypothetical protein
VHVLVDQAAGTGIDAGPTGKFDADDLYVHGASVPEGFGSTAILGGL